MAYRVKYTTGIFHRHGHTFELTISQRDYYGSQRDYYGSRMTIGTPYEVALEVQGGQSSIDAPIVKTSLHLSWAEADDLSTRDVKCGGFEEFYTPDSTLYLVTLYRDGREYWSGYLTPDAWSENLAYHTHIAVTARDNIGHLQDFPFEVGQIQGAMHEGLCSLEQIIRSAMQLIDLPLDLRFVSTSGWLSAGLNTAPYDFLFDPHVFDGDTWYDAVEKCLEDFGAALRFVGGNTLWCAPLRWLHRLGSNADQTPRGCLFVGRSATRTLDSAYKQAIDKGQYELAEDYMPTFGASDWNGNGFIKKDGWSEYPQGTAKRMVYDFGGDRVPDVTRCIYLRVYPDDEKAGASLAFTRAVAVGSSVHVSANARNLYYGDAESPFPANRILPHDCYRKIHLEYRLLWDADSPQIYTGSAWTDFNDAEMWTSRQDYGWRGNQLKGYTWEDAAPIDLTVTTPDIQGRLVLELRAWGEDYDDASGIGEVLANWIRLDSFAVQVEGSSIPNGWKVTTDYDLNQNTTVTHDATLGIVPDFILTPGAIKNGIYLRTPDDRGAYALRDAAWPDMKNLPAPFPVFTSLQRLALHADAYSVFTGELMAEDGYMDFGTVYEIYGRKCLLVSGTLNMMTSRVENAVLREFNTYDEVFGRISIPTYDCVTGGEGNYGNNTSATGSGSASGGSGGSGGGVSAYNQLSGKPSIDGVTINGEMASYDDLRLMGREFFEKVNIGTPEAPVWAIHFFTPLYSDGTISAGGRAKPGQGGGEGGSTIEWTQYQNDGAHIADIRIDGVLTEIYAPTGGRSNVSWGTQSGMSIALIVDGVSKRLSLAGHTHSMEDEIDGADEWFNSMIAAWQDGNGGDWVDGRVGGWIDGWLPAEGEQWLDSHNFALQSDIPTLLSQLRADTGHQTVTEAEKRSWNAKMDERDLSQWLDANGFIGRNAIVALISQMMPDVAQIQEQLNEQKRITRKLQPSGAAIPSGAELNAANYAKVGSFYCALDATAVTLGHCPTDRAFIMENLNPLSTALDDETKAYTYRVRIITDREGRQFVQQASTGATPGSWTWGEWKQTENNRDEVTWYAARNFANAKNLQWIDTRGTKRTAMFLDGSNAFQIGRGMADAGYNTYLDGNTVKLRAGNTHSTIMDIATDRIATSAMLEPSVRDVYDLGSTTKRYRTAFVNEIVLTNGTHSIKLDLDADGLLRINGSGYFTGNAAAGGKAQPSED